MLGPSVSGGERERGALNFVNWCCRNADPNGYKPVPVNMAMPNEFNNQAINQCKAAVQNSSLFKPYSKAR